MGIVFSIALLNSVLPIFPQTYTYVELSSKNQKQVASAKKSIEKSMEQENTLGDETVASSEKKLITLYQSRIADYRTIYETYSSHNYEFWTKFKGDPQEVSVALDLSSEARDVYIAAQNIYNESDRTHNDVEKLKILKNACKKFKQATDLIEKAYEIYRSTPLESDDFTKKRNLQRNDSLQKVLYKSSPASKIDSSNSFGILPVEITDNYSIPQQSDTKDNETVNSTQSDMAIHNPDMPVETHQTLSAPLQSQPANYWVQIAACRVPLSREQLLTLISDTLNIVEKYIDYWYKYRVGPFKLEQAKAFQQKCHIKGAFIIPNRKL
jgi:mRNA-degrading endonuclease RelE of RelBE toxin-antitoxin system